LIKILNQSSLILLNKKGKNIRGKILIVNAKKNTKKIKRKRKKDICNNKKKRILMMMEWGVFFRIKPAKMMKNKTKLMRTLN
jgi:hypothetical protein